ncbi:hypothetical protein RJD39_04810 [Vibrio scophthalmi]|uniref:hypothetical protein n=1 Tax=Vibrio scophthalmi TaxID=45658 RepID=UPI0038733884
MKTNAVIEKYAEIEKRLGDYLAELNQNPPFGFGKFLTPLNLAFQMCRILGNQMQAQAKQIEQLQKQLASLPSSIEPKEAANDE